MACKQFTILNHEGLHIRPASELASALKEYESEVVIRHHGQSFNAKSIIKLLSACIKMGDSIELVASGADEQEAMDVAERLIASGA